MRVVNMAHGSFYLLGGYIAYEIQQAMTGQGYAIARRGQYVGVGAAAARRGAVHRRRRARHPAGVPALEPGQELRQALITIAVSVIVADQIIAHFPRTVSTGAQKFGGNAVSLTWPGWTDRLVNLHVWGVQYSLARLVMLALGVAVGVALWLWLYRTKTGMVIRAGVDDEKMTSALGINIQKTFAIAFVVGSASLPSARSSGRRSRTSPPARTGSGS